MVAGWNDTRAVSLYNYLGKSTNMKVWAKHIVATGLAIAVIGAGIAATQPAYADVAEERRAEMKKIAKANKALKRASKAGKRRAAKRQAWAIIASANRVALLFPRGTDRRALGRKTTRARAKIWSDWSTFEAKLNGMKRVARKVAGGNMAAAKRMGKTCGGCHKRFRAGKNEKIKKIKRKSRRRSRRSRRKRR